MSHGGRQGALFRALRQMGENPWLSGVAVSTLTLALVIVGAYASLCLNLDAVGRRLTTGAVLVLVLAETVTPDQAQSLSAEIARWPQVTSAAYVPSQKALERFRRQLGPHAGLLDGLESNPLPEVVEVEVKPEAQAFDQAADRAGRLVQVKEVVTSRPWLHRLEEAFGLMGRFAAVLGVLLFLGLVIMSANVVRLAVYVRRYELEVMDLVGAPASYISRPFLIEAMIQGLVAAGLASLVLWLLFILFGSAAQLPLGVRLNHILSLPAEVPLILAGSGMLAGLIGGWLGVGRVRRADGL